MAMDFGFTKWNRCWVSGLPIDNPLFCLGRLKSVPGCVNWTKIVHVLWLELCGIVMSSSELICMLVD